MSPKSQIPILAELLKSYFEMGEVVELARIFGIEFEVGGPTHEHAQWLPIARRLIVELDRGNMRELTDSLLKLIEIRNDRAIAITTFERRAANEALRPLFVQLRCAFEASSTPAEIVVPASKPFTAKSGVREFLASASTEVLVVDPYIGAGTLDCLRSLSVAVRLLTGTSSTSIEKGFERVLKAYQDEGGQITIRRHSHLHDRHFVFNDRCWLIGSSLKDAGLKAFHVIEITDSRAEVMANVNVKWIDGAGYP